MLIHTVIGTALVAGGAAALNQVLERDIDRLMRRTQSRPLPGRPSRRSARPLVRARPGAGSGWSSWRAAPTCSRRWWRVTTIASYALVYTPLKTRTSLATVDRRRPGRAAADDRLGGGNGSFVDRGLGAVRDRVLLADAARARDLVDVSRGLRPRRHSRAAGRGAGRREHVASDGQLCGGARARSALLPTVVGLAGGLYLDRSARARLGPAGAARLSSPGNAPRRTRAGCSSRRCSTCRCSGC